MNKILRSVLAGAALVVVVASWSSASVQAAPSAATRHTVSQSTHPYTIVGSGIHEVPSPSAFPQHGATFYNVAKMLNQWTGIRYFVVQERAINGTWAAPFTVSMSSSIPGGAVEMAYNPQTHLELVAVGMQQQSLSLGTLQQPLSLGPHTANLETDATDPFGFNVVSVYDYQTFWYDNNCVTDYYYSFPSTYLLNDGWYTNSETHSWGYEVGCNFFGVRTVGKYTNPDFCYVITGGLGSPTVVQFNPAESDSKYDGTYAYSIFPSFSGGCSGLLHWSYSWH